MGGQEGAQDIYCSFSVYDVYTKFLRPGAKLLQRLRNLPHLHREPKLPRLV